MTENKEFPFFISPGLLTMILLGLLLVLIVASGIISASFNSLLRLDERTGLLLASTVQDIVAFFISAYIVAKLSASNPLQFIGLSQRSGWRPFVGAAIVFIIGFPLMNQLIYWNQSISLPDSMSGVETALRQWETSAATTTSKILSAKGVGALVSGIAVIGLLTGLCEEVFFRGALQKLLNRWNGNGIVAIIVASFIFSALHFQFFGFIPRWLLGAFFGYLYYSTGSLWPSVFTHALNNSSVVVFSWLSLYGYETESIENFGVAETGFPLAASISAIAVVLFFIFFRKQFFQNR